MRHGLAAFPPQYVGKAPFAAPKSRKKRSGREKMGQPNQAGPKNGDPDQNQQAVTAEPMHAGIISENVEARMSNVEGIAWMNQVVIHNVRLSSRFFVTCQASFARLLSALRTIWNVLPLVRRRGTSRRATPE